MRTLISMTDFVLKQYEEWAFATESKDVKERDLAYSRYVGRTEAYANFLSQPLTLSMFVPVSETGEVLSDPTGHGMIPRYNEKIKEYNAAKEKVLFEGVRTRTDMYGSTKRMFVDIGNFGAIRIYERFDFHAGNSTQQFLPSINEMTVEELIPLQIELTPTALKQIFG